MIILIKTHLSAFKLFLRGGSIKYSTISRRMIAGIANTFCFNCKTQSKGQNEDVLNLETGLTEISVHVITIHVCWWESGRLHAEALSLLWLR